MTSPLIMTPLIWYMYILLFKSAFEPSHGIISGLIIFPVPSSPPL